MIIYELYRLSLLKLHFLFNCLTKLHQKRALQKFLFQFKTGNLHLKIVKVFFILFKAKYYLTTYIKSYIFEIAGIHSEFFK